jgi:hypothetical protein
VREELRTFKAKIRASCDEVLSSSMPKGAAGDILKRTVQSSGIWIEFAQDEARDVTIP